ncbi:MFS transporter [Sorangium sp. So ce117]|uniref:MFS transporter n=1 Tax=Sorangium sp. So ce117 TaxID=3133277 RepID=UPI003F5DF68F
MHSPEAEADRLPETPAVSRAYAWLVFALSFGLLLSDHMSRQVLSAVFPSLKMEWGLSDTQMGALSGIVALMVGLLTIPLSLLADRWGRVRSMTLMATVWSVATLGCALSANFGEMFAARLVVGVGEAAYGSVGTAVVLALFPRHQRASLSGALMAGGAFGAVLGMALGGYIAARVGWRWSFGAIALFGLILVVIYRTTVTERRLRPAQDVQRAAVAQPPARRTLTFRFVLKALFSTPSFVCVCVGSGLQLFIMGAVVAWMPSYLNRYYGMAIVSAGVTAAVFVLIGGVGMTVCGVLTDRLSRHRPACTWRMAIAYSLTCCALLGVALRLPAGRLQMVLMGAGALFMGGTAGPAGAMVAGLIPASIHATAFATLALANNLLGLAPGPVVLGVLADRIGLLGALQVIPFVALAAALVFALGERHSTRAPGQGAPRARAEQRRTDA